MDVVFETDDGRRFEEKIRYFSTVLDIKETLHKRHGFPISRQTLFFDGVIMEDEQGIESYNIVEGFRILLRLQPDPSPEPETEPEPVPDPIPEPKPDPPKAIYTARKRVMVTVLVPRQEIWMKKAEVTVVVNLADTVRQLKKELLRINELSHDFYLHAGGFFFIYKQSVMKENRTFKWYDVRSNDVIEVLNRSVTHSLK